MPHAGPHNLPASRDSFIGRIDEMGALARLLGVHRVVTITGPAGIGKTRLAIEAAAAGIDHHPDGVWLVELADVARGALVPQAVASVLSVPDQSGRSHTEAVVDRLRVHSRTLVVLDNAEHVIDDCARLVEVLARECPGVTILVTSQAPLGVEGEAELAVPALAVPNGEVGDLGVLAACPSVALFCNRAASQHGFALEPHDAPAVANICRRLDGVPLAVELAAARVGVLSPAEIAARLDDRFRLLTGGGRAVLPRHQTLKGAIDWSYDLLTDAEKALLRRVSVFRGGATTDAVEDVCSGGDVERDEVPRLLGALATRSLVRVADTRTGRRYAVLETIRQYGKEQLEEAGEAGEWRARHASWCVELAEKAEPWLTGPEQRAWFDRLTIEHDNLRAALAWAATDGPAELAARLCAALTLFWRIRGHFHEGWMWASAALAVSAELGGQPGARLRWSAGFMALMIEDPAVFDILEQALTGFRELHDGQGVARSLLLLGNAWVFVDSAKAVDVLAQSVALAREVDDQWCLSHALAECGLARLLRWELAAARGPLEESVAVGRSAGDDQGLRIGLSLLGDLSLATGDYDMAEAVLSEALGVVRELDEDYGIAAALAGLGELATARGDYRRAGNLLGEGLRVARDTGNASLTAGLLDRLGACALARGDLSEARQSFEEASLLPRVPGLSSVVGLGEVLAATGDERGAREALAEVLNRAELLGEQQVRAQALHGLGGLARGRGDAGEAWSLHCRALEIRSELGDRRGVSESLEALGCLGASSTKRTDAALAVRLLAAAHATRQAQRYARPPAQAAAYAADLAGLRHRLGDERFDAEWAAGGRLSAEGALAQALRGHASSHRATSGWASLSEAEIAVAKLVSAGLTNSDIAERLFVSRSTVKSHLGRMYAKLGILSRVELAQEVTRHLKDAPQRAIS